MSNAIRGVFMIKACIFYVILLLGGVVYSQEQRRTLPTVEFSYKVDGAAAVSDDNPISYAVINSTYRRTSILGGERDNGYLIVDYGKEIPADNFTVIDFTSDGNAYLNTLRKGGGKVFIISILDKDNNVISKFESDKGPDVDGFFPGVGKGNTNRVLLKSRKPYQKLRIQVAANGSTTSNYTLAINSIYAIQQINEGESDWQLPFSGYRYTSGDLLNGASFKYEDDLANAFDENILSAAEISSGGVLNISLGSNNSITFNFSSKSKAGDTFRMLIGAKGNSLLSLKLGDVRITAYDGSQKVYQRAFSDGFASGLSVLGSVGTGEVQSLVFSPGKPFDRIEIAIGKFLEASVIGTDVLSIYEVKRFASSGEHRDPDLDDIVASVTPFTQPLCASVLRDNENTDFPLSAVDGNNESYATIQNKGNLTLGFEEELPAFTTSYLRLDLAELIVSKEQGLSIISRSDILNYWSDGVLGQYKNRDSESLLKDIRIDIVAVNNQGVSVLSGNTTNSFNTVEGGELAVVKDALGRYYLAVTPNRAYRKLTVKNSLPTKLAGITLRIHDLCTEVAKSDCLPPIFTSTTAEGTALNFTKLALAGTAVLNKEKIFSPGSEDSVEFSIGNHKDIKSIRQRIYFGQPSSANSKLRLDVRVLGKGQSAEQLRKNYKLRLYLGGQEVHSLSLEEGLTGKYSAETVFGTNGVQSLLFSITRQYDRADLVVEGVNAPLLALYDVQRVCNEEPVIKNFSSLNNAICATGIVEANNIDHLQNIGDGDLNSRAIMHTNSLLPSGERGSDLKMFFNHTVPGNTTSYIRIALNDEEIWHNLLNIPFGSTNLGKYLNFEVEVIKEGRVLFNRSTTEPYNGSFNHNFVRFVQDNSGMHYIAINAVEGYDSVRLVLREVPNALSPVQLSIDNLCYEGDIDPCILPYAAFGHVDSFIEDISSIGVFGLSNGLRFGEESSTGARLALGTYRDPLKVSYHLLFNSLSLASDVTTVGLRLPKGPAITLEDLKHVVITAYNQGNEVAVYNWGNGIVTDLEDNELQHDIVAQLNSKQQVVIPFKVGKTYDRLVVSLQQDVYQSIREVEVTGVKRWCMPASADLVAWKSYKVFTEDTKIHRASDGSTSSYTIEGNLSEYTTSVKGGEVVEYTIHIRNTGEEDLSGFIITDTLPQGMQWIAGGILFDKVVTLNTSVVLQSDEELSLSFVVKVDDYLLDDSKQSVASFVNIAEVVSDKTTEKYYTYPPVDYEDPKEPNTNDEEGTVLSTRDHYSLEVHKTGLAKRIYGKNNALNPFYWWDNILEQKENEINYTIEIKNNGNRPFSFLDISDDFIRNDHVVSGDKGEGEFVLNSSSGVSSHTITKNGLAIGETAKYSFSVKTKSAYRGTLIHNEVVAKGLVDGTVTATAATDFKIDGVKLQGEDAYELNIATSDFITFSGPVMLCADDDQYEFVVGLSDQAYRLSNEEKINLEYPVFKWFDKNPELDEATHGEHKPIFIGERLVKKFEETTTLYLVVEGYHWRPNMHIGDVKDTYPTMGDTYTPKVVTIYVHDLPEKPIIQLKDNSSATVVGNQVSICSGGDVVLTTQQESVGYQWYFNGKIIDNDYGRQRDLPIYSPGKYSVVATNGRCGSTASEEFEITFLPTASLTFDRKLYFLPLERGSASFTLPRANTKIVTVEESVAAALDVVWYDHTGKKIDNIQAPYLFTEYGTYTFTATASTGAGCADAESITIIITGEDGCPPEQKRVYGSSDGWGTTLIGWVSNREGAYDEKPNTHSTITIGVGLLGLGTTWQNIYFDEVVPAGTPLHIKLGKEYSAVDVASAITVVGLDKDGKTIGTLKAVDGDVLSLLAADNIIEYSFVPSNESGPKEYKGVRVILGAAVAVATSMKVYEVYYEKLVGEGEVVDTCTTEGMGNSVKDVLFGVKAPLGLNIASATSSVVNPWNAVDDDLDTYATISRVVAVANGAYLTAIFKQIVMPTDELHIAVDMSDVPVLSLALLEGIKIQRYLGDQAIGEAIDVKEGVLDLTLLGINYQGRRAIIVVKKGEGANYQPYDRVEISYGTVLSVFGDFIRVYDISVVPTIALDYTHAERIEGEELTNPDPGYQVDLCHGGILQIPHYDDCTTINVFKAPTGDERYVVNYLESNSGNTAVSTVSLEMLLPGSHTIYIQNFRYGCPIGPRIPVEVKVQESPQLFTYTIGDKELARPYHITTRANRLLKLGTTNTHVTITRWLLKKDDAWVAISEVFDMSGTAIGDFRIPVDYRAQTLYIKPEIQTIGEGSLGCIGYGEEISIEVKGSINRIKTNLNVTSKINGTE